VHFLGTCKKENAAQCQIPIFHAGETRLFSEVAIAQQFSLVLFVSACSWFALVTGVGGYVLAEVEIGVLSCIFFYFCGC